MSHDASRRLLTGSSSSYNSNSSSRTLSSSAATSRTNSKHGSHRRTGSDSNTTKVVAVAPNVIRSRASFNGAASLVATTITVVDSRPSRVQFWTATHPRALMHTWEYLDIRSLCRISSVSWAMYDSSNGSAILAILTSHIYALQSFVIFVLDSKLWTRRIEKDFPVARGTPTNQRSVTPSSGVVAKQNYGARATHRAEQRRVCMGIVIVWMD